MSSNLLWLFSMVNIAVTSRDMGSYFITEKRVYETPDNDSIVLEKCNFVLDKSLKSPGIKFRKKCGNLGSEALKTKFRMKSTISYSNAEVCHFQPKFVWEVCNFSWWRHQMEMFSALRAIVRGIHCVATASDADLWCFLWSAPEKKNDWENNRGLGVEREGGAGVYWIQLVRPSVCMSLRPSVRPPAGGMVSRA